jgi:hypothetical protein
MATRGPVPLALALGLLAACLVLVRARLEPPPPLPGDAPAGRFAAGRALARLATLVGDDVPHPVGSPAGVRMRERLLAEFTALGLAAEVQTDLACTARGAGCGRVGNVVARLPGREGGPALLVSAHHDSVAAGPGAGDDGAGVAAVLELARALTSGPPPRRDVLFLLVDGEESGLLGAQAFVDAHPWWREVGAAVNLDAGGTRGVTSLTRTSPGNALQVAAFAAAPRPYGASVIGAVYGLTPYDTDFSVYARAGVASLDLGFGEDKAHYHTPLDRLAHLDPASVQHLGDTALAVVRALADADLPAPPAPRALHDPPPPRPWRGERVFLDALGLALVAWPATWTPPLALLALALLSLATWRTRHVLRDMPDRPRRTAVAGPARAPGPGADPSPPAGRGLLVRRLLAALALPLLVLGPALVGAALMWLLALLTAAEVPGHAEPLPARVALWAAELAVGGAVAARLHARLGAARLTLGLWWGLVVLTAALAVAAPAASVGVLPPALLSAAVLAGSSRHVPKDMSAWPGVPALLLTLLLPGLMWLQAGVRVEAIFGLGPAAAGVFALLVALLAPLWPARPRGLVRGIGLLAVGAAALALTRPAYTAERPRRLSLVHHLDADAGVARWLVDGDVPLPDALREVGGFAARPAPAFAWTPEDEPSWVAPTSYAPVHAPELTREPGVPEVRGAWGRYLRLRLRSPRGARSAALVVPDAAGLRWISVDGRTLPPYPPHRREWYLGVRHHTVVALPPDGVRVELVVRADAPVEFTVLDVAEGLPPAGAALQAARPAWAVPSHGGDRSVVSRVFTH